MTIEEDIRRVQESLPRIQDQEALSRIETEFERLRADVGRLNAYGEDLGWVHPEEFERLRAELSLSRIHDRDCRAREDEVERLRARTAELEDVLLALCQTPCPNMYDERWARADEVLKKVGK
jgi:predicted nuclease with TOPRIM domain